MNEPLDLTVAHVDSETGFSGGEVQVFLLMEGLRELGVRNVLYCPPDSRCARECESRGFEARSVPMRNDLDWPGVRAMRRGFAADVPDLIHLHTGRGAWLGGLAGSRGEAPVIVTRRQDRDVKRNFRTRAIYGPLSQRAVAISRGVAACMVAGGVDESKILVIPSALDTRRLSGDEARERKRAENAVDDETVLILGAGSLVHRKGFDVLIEAFARLDDVTKCLLVLAGGGPERGALEQRANDLGVSARTRFLGPVDDLGAWLAACDVFAMPSRREGLGVVSLEAMGTGRPVVASAVGGLEEAVAHGETGLLVPPGDVEELARSLSSLAADPDERSRLGAAGPGWVAGRFSAEKMVTAYADLYRIVIAEWKSR